MDPSENLAWQPRSIDDFALETFAARLDAIECDDEKVGLIETTATGALLTAVGCRELPSTNVTMNNTWVDDREVPVLTDWSSQRDLMTALSELEAVSGPQAVSLKWASGSANLAESFQGMTLVAPATVQADGSNCSTTYIRYAENAESRGGTSGNIRARGCDTAYADHEAFDFSSLDGGKLYEALNAAALDAGANLGNVDNIEIYVEDGTLIARALVGSNQGVAEIPR